MPQAEREICHRLRDFRLKTGATQAQFAVLADLKWSTYVGFEYAKTQLNYPAACKILNFFRQLNPVWLVDGTGEMLEDRNFEFPSPESVGIGRRALFSRVFRERFRASFLKQEPLRIIHSGLPVKMFGFPPSSMGRTNNKDRFGDLLSGWLSELPDDQVAVFLDELFLHAASLMAKFPRDPDLSAIERRKQEMQEIEVRRRNLSSDSQNYELTHMLTEDKTEPVNQWHRLKQRIRKGASLPGDKSALAKFLGVNLTQLSRWLAASKSAPEPGADYTLKMLQWVQERERKQ